MEQVRIQSAPLRNLCRSRAPLWWGLGTIILLHSSAVLVYEYGAPGLRDAEFTGLVLSFRQHLQARPDASLTAMFLGSSRVCMGCSCIQLETQLTASLGQPIFTHNLGRAGAGPVAQHLYLERLIRSGIRPDWLFVEVLSPLLSETCGAVELGKPPGQWISFRELATLRQYGFPVGSTSIELARFYLSAASFQKLPIVRRGLRKWGPWSPPHGLRNLPADYSGWSPYNLTPTPDVRQRATDHARIDYTPHLSHFRLGGPNCRALHNLLILCREQRIPVALILMPEGPEFRSWYTEEGWQSIQGFLDELSSTYSVPIINARDWIDEQDFLDSHHLLRQGAVDFTQRLAQDKLAPLFAGDLHMEPHNTKAVRVISRTASNELTR
jgi:hypothetical protein